MQVGHVDTQPPSSGSNNGSPSIMQPLSNPSGLGPGLLMNYRGQEYQLSNNGSMQFLGYTSPVSTQSTPKVVSSGSSSSSSSTSILSNLSDTDYILIAGAIVVLILVL